MKDQFIPYEYAKMMKELSYNEKNIAWSLSEGKTQSVGVVYNNQTLEDECSLPTWAEVEEWLWEKFNIVVSVSDISIHHEGYSDYEFEVTITDKDGLSIDYIDSFESPIQAKKKGILKSIEYLNKSKK